MALSPYMMRMMGSQMGGIAPGTISGLTQPMTLGVPAVQPLMGMAAMPAMGSGVPEDSMTKARRVIKEAMSDAPQGIDPDLAAILNRREARLAEQEKNIEDKGSVWDRLGRFSAALLTNESPFFSVGLGRAVATTLADEQRLREAAAQRREAIAQQREEIGMERVRQKGAGRAQAMEQLKTTFSLAKDIGGMEGDALENEAKRIANQFAPQEAAARINKLNQEVKNLGVSLALDNARIDEVKSSTAKNYADIVKGRAEGAGGTSGDSLTEEEKLARNLDPDLPWVYDKNGIPRLPTGFKAPPGQRGSVAPEQTLATIGRAEGLLPKASSGGIAGAGTAVAEYFGRSTDRSKADAQLRVLAGQLTSSVPRFEGPQALAEVKLYQAMAADVANSELPYESRLAALNEMKGMVNRNIEFKKKQRQGGGETETSTGRRLSPAEAAKLRPGTPFLDLDGNPRVRK